MKYFCLVVLVIAAACDPALTSDDREGDDVGDGGDASVEDGSLAGDDTPSDVDIDVDRPPLVPATAVTGARGDVTALLYPFADGPAMPVHVTNVETLAATFPLDATARAHAELYFANGGTDLWVVRDNVSQLVGLVPRVNLLVAPEATNIAELVAFAEAQDIFYLLEPPAAVATPSAARTWIDGIDALRSDHAIVYFPHIVVPQAAGTLTLGGSVAIAGYYGGSERAAGIWHTPAGDMLAGVPAVAVTLTNVQVETYLQSTTNASLNALRVFGDEPAARVWGGRTTSTTPSPERYVGPARLLAHIRHSVREFLATYADTPNDATTWTAIRAAVSDFVHALYVGGALQGNTRNDAYFVQCGPTTMTSADIANGRLVVLIGVAPISPAEFIIERVEQQILPPQE